MRVCLREGVIRFILLGPAEIRFLYHEVVTANFLLYRADMFNRFVYMKLKTEWASAEGCASVIAESKRVLPTIPGVLQCRAGVPVDASAAKGWDLCLVLDFASAEDIEEYRVHPEHQKFLEEFLGPKVEAKRAWNFAMQKLS